MAMPRRSAAISRASEIRKPRKADRISAWMEATRIAGFSETEATKFFGCPAPELIAGLDIVLRPPVAVRADFTARHADLMAHL